MSLNSTCFGEGLQSFGPTMPGQFDFTPLFENSLLSMLPSAVLLFVLPIRLRSLHKQSQKVSRSHLHTNKLVFIIIFAAFQAAILVLYAANSKTRTPTTVAAASLVFADALGLCFLSHAEHIRTIRPSTIINTYLLATFLFDVARTRTLWIDNAPKPIVVVFTITTGVKLIIAVTEAIEKRKILLSQYQNHSPEVTSGIYSRSFFWWLNKLMRTGYLQNLSDDDLYLIEDDMSSSVLKSRAQTCWNDTDRSRPNALFWSTLKANHRQLAVCVLPRLCLSGFRYAQPFLLLRTVNFVKSTKDSDNIGWSLTAAFGLVFLGMAISSGSYYHMTYRFVTSVRGSLVTMIFAKTVDLSITALNESAAITLMSNDTETICQGFQTIHEIWAVPLELGIALWLLQRQLGLSFVAPAAVAIVSTVSIIGISKYIGGAQKIWNQGIQTRVDVTTTILGSMKAVKMLGFTNKLTEILQELRVEELRLSKLFRRLLCARVFFANSMRIFAPLATFTLFVLVEKSTRRELTTATAYTTLSLLALLSSPINTLLRTIPMLVSALACFERIQSYLESDSRHLHALPLNSLSSSSTSQILANADVDIELENLSVRRQPCPDSIILDVRNASFSWGVNEFPTIDDVSFSVSRGDFSFIIGPIGCGKSTLLKGLMSETPSSKGFVYSDSSEIGFVDQTSWIQNKTVRQNILGQSGFDEAWYKEVLKACALDHDISSFPSSDGTIVGSGGISLSGGQKQRLAIARALYAKKVVIIIDDAFAGLDAETEELVFLRIFGRQGLLRRSGTTVILVTHAVHRLPYADHIIALDAAGRIAEQGDFEHLRNANGYVEGLATKHRYEDGCSPDRDFGVDVLFTEPQSGAVEIDKVKTLEVDLIRPNGELSTYKYYAASIGWSRSILSVSIMLFSGVTIKLTELLLTYWTSATASHGSEVNPFYLGMFAMLSGLSILTFNVGTYHYFLYVVPGSAEELHARLLRAVMGAPLHVFTSTDTGTTTNRFSQDMSIVDGELPFALIDLIFSMIQSIMGGILMCVSAGYFTLTMPPVVFVVWVIQKYYLRTSRQIRILDLEAKAPLYSHFIESLSGLVTIRAFGWSDEFMAQNLVLLDNSQKPYYLLFCIQRWLALVLDVMVAILAVILMVLVVRLRGSIAPGFVGLALLNVMGFSEYLAWNVKQWTALETSIGAISRLKNFAELTPNENLEGENQPVPEIWPASGGVELKNVSAAYANDVQPIIQGINMSIKHGEKIGICGRTGSGKSSLIMTLFRMLEVGPESSILVDGIDITKIPREIVRSRFNAIPQDQFFMKGSVRLNSSPENTHSDTEIITALRKVQLWSMVESKGGLGVELDANFFSHGQRQLFCLARGILRKSKIVVLDEVSSSMDVTTDKVIQLVIRREFADATIIAVAHRLNTILDFDRVALLNDGKLVEFDSPQTLLSRPSAFRDLYNS